MLARKPVEIPGLAGDLLPTGRIVLITGHRRENFGDGFRSICDAIARLAARYADVCFVYPVHLNPNVLGPVTSVLGNNRFPNLHLIEPLSYLPFVQLMTAAYVILSDSGGVQEEAPSLGKPVFVMRETTERPEGVAAGACRLVGTDADSIFNEVSNALDNPEHYRRMAQVRNVFGDGQAAIRIRDACLGFLEISGEVL